jgi:hypothetical protein
LQPERGIHDHERTSHFHRVDVHNFDKFLPGRERMCNFVSGSPAPNRSRDCDKPQKSDSAGSQQAQRERAAPNDG